MNMRIQQAESSRSVFTFRAAAGEHIKAVFSSQVREGDLELSILDSEGNIVETFESNISSNKEVVLEKEDTYSMVALYQDVVGVFKVKITSLSQ